MKITESLLRSSGVGRFPGLGNRCTFVLAKQQAEKYISATELELIRFWPLPLGEFVWHLCTQVNDSDLVAYRNLWIAAPPKCSSFRQRGGTNVRKRYVKIGGGGVQAYRG